MLRPASVVLVLAAALLAPAAGLARVGKIRDFAVPQTLSHPTGIAIGSDGAVWFAQPATGSIGRRSMTGAFSSFELPDGSYPNDIVSGPDGALWYTDYPGDHIGRIATAGSITQFPLGAHDLGVWNLAVGSDGALWFTEIDANAIGRITTSGQVTHFPLPEGMDDPFAITAGPDGALWFTNSYGVGRITTSGGLSQVEN